MRRWRTEVVAGTSDEWPDHWTSMEAHGGSLVSEQVNMPLNLSQEETQGA